MSVFVNLLFRPWFYAVTVIAAVLLLDPVKVRCFPLFLGTAIYMGAIWAVFAMHKSRLYECKPRNTAIAYGLLMLAPPALYVSGAYGSAFATAYLLILAGLVFPVPHVDAYKYMEADANKLRDKRKAEAEQQ